MGGDIGPAVMIAGMARARRKDRSLRFDLFGDEAQIAPELAKHQPLVDAVSLHHCTDSIHDHQPKRFAGDIDAVAKRIGAEQ